MMLLVGPVLAAVLVPVGPLLFLTFLWTFPIAPLKDPLSPGRPPGLKTMRMMTRTTTSLGVFNLRNTQTFSWIDIWLRP